MTSTYTSAALRVRDKAMNDKYQKEIKDLEAKIERLRHQNDQHQVSIFDARNSGQRLARSLGFDDVLEAQVAIDSSDYQMPLGEIFKRLEGADAATRNHKNELEDIENKLKSSEEARKKLECENKILSKEKAALEKRYDELVNTKERANKRFQSDFKNWQRLYLSNHPEDASSRRYEHAPDLTIEEKQRRMFLIEQQRSRLLKMLDGQNSMKGTPRVKKEKDVDKENELTPTTSTKKRRFGTDSPASSSAVSKTTPLVPLRNGLLQTVTNMTVPSSSPTIFNPRSSATISSAPLTLKPIPDVTNVKQEPSSPLRPFSPVNSHKSSSPSANPHIHASSETEEDSQAIPCSVIDRTGKTIISKMPAPTPIAGPIRTSNPINNIFVPPRSSIHDISPRQTLFRSSNIARIHRETHESERPKKLRRLSENSHEFVSGSSNSHTDPRPNLKCTMRADENAASTPLTIRNLGQKRLEDYSAFKGRGRYGKAVEGPKETTINALYTIDPAQNAGKDFQYDEVVRNRDDRRKLNGGDCECCREYYENVGPLPSRLKQPLWRSPPSSPIKPCPRHPHLSPESDRRPPPLQQSDIDVHKKAISRHRHNWDRATTPPAYWDIGFPSTQEAGAINLKAKEMHERKKEQVAKEAAAEGGRYRKR